MVKRQNSYANRIFTQLRWIDPAKCRQRLLLSHGVLSVSFRSPTTWRQIGSLKFSCDASLRGLSFFVFNCQFQAKINRFLSCRFTRHRYRIKATGLLPEIEDNKGGKRCGFRSGFGGRSGTCLVLARQSSRLVSKRSYFIFKLKHCIDL